MEKRSVIRKAGITLLDEQDMIDIDEAGYKKYWELISAKRKKWRKSLAKSICDS